MKVVFVSDTFHHHQKPFSDEMYRLTEGNYTFITTRKMSEERLKMGWGKSPNPSYVFNLDMNNKRSLSEAIKMIDNADVVITGSAPLCLLKNRRKLGKITFRYSERLYKTRSRYLKMPIHAYRAWWMKNSFMLCSSAYTSRDYSLSANYIKRCFKWGYFTKLKIYDDINKLIESKRKVNNEHNGISILWVSRFIKLKHPEIVIDLAKKLRNEGVRFRLEMIGIGPLEKEIRESIINNNLTSFITISGSMSPEEVRLRMERSSIFIFTSDRHEGWGAVMNESMNSACAVVACDSIGSVPFLIVEGENGYTYKQGDVEELFRKVYLLCSNSALREQIALNAYNAILKTWNAGQAARNIIKLIDDLLNNRESSINEGPCSMSMPLDLDGKHYFNVEKYDMWKSVRFMIKDILGI